MSGDLPGDDMSTRLWRAEWAAAEAQREVAVLRDENKSLRDQLTVLRLESQLLEDTLRQATKRIADGVLQ